MGHPIKRLVSFQNLFSEARPEQELANDNGCSCVNILHNLGWQPLMNQLDQVRDPVSGA